ncbi:hypothetical protein C8Q69DRAFT_459646 [Paecilomyces variotii]|uniref:Secreted protein n=1 Tax=Byssochlamys spectabilis TaxID=264951 RepID=A0A443I3K3_BYSSP|nr:hypothetical protein C8Q69DRAFT_459646 [Paecilomyces variotii]RWQ98658.1 hypothetical protein C8Q69DRAFT_459646 [Paecilomyces variotii]
MRRLGRVPLLAVVVAAALAHFLVPAAAPAIALSMSGTCTRKSMTFAYLLSTHRVNQYKKAMPPMTINPPMIVRPYIWPISHWLAEKEAV